MNTKKIEKTVMLTANLDAKIIVERTGQQDPYYGDGVVATATILLPGILDDDGLVELAPELRFGQRLVICEEFLRATWGDAYRLGGEIQSVRKYKRNFTADTWAKAFCEAGQFANAEVKKLVDAINTRAKALVDAEGTADE